MNRNEVMLLAVARQAAEAIKHVRQVKDAWSPAQIEAFLAGVEQSARIAIAKMDDLEARDERRPLDDEDDEDEEPE